MDGMCQGAHCSLHYKCRGTEGGAAVREGVQRCGKERSRRSHSDIVWAEYSLSYLRLQASPCRIKCAVPEGVPGWFMIHFMV